MQFWYIQVVQYLKAGRFRIKNPGILETEKLKVPLSFTLIKDLI